MLSRRHQLIYFLQDNSGVANYRYIGAHILANFGGVDINVDNPGFRSKTAHLSCRPVIKSHSDSNNEVGVGNGHIGVSHAVHPDHAETEGMTLGETTDTQ